MYHDTVLLDVSHSPGPPLFVSGQQYIQTSPYALFILAAVSVVMTVTVLRYGGRTVDSTDQTPIHPTPDTGDVLAMITQRHPEWSRERIERVIDSLLQRTE
jgi:hypothetical protein